MMRVIRSSLSRKMQYKSLIHSPSMRSLRNYLLTSVLICLMNTLTGLNAEAGGLYVASSAKYKDLYRLS